MNIHEEMLFERDATTKDPNLNDNSTPKTENIIIFVDKFMNTISDNLMINTYTFLWLKLDIPNWHNKDEIFDLGVIDKESYKHSI